MHGRWISYLQRFSFVLKHKSGEKNKVVDALSRRVELLVILKSSIIGFDHLKELYANDEDFKQMWNVPIKPLMLKLMVIYFIITVYVSLVLLYVKNLSGNYMEVV